MTNRFNIPDSENELISSLKSGYATKSVSDVSIPSNGIEDIDAAVFKLFDKELPLQISGDDNQFTKVPIIFAGAEKWALLKKNRPIRDRTGSLILPLITIGRVNQNQTKEDISGRGINQKVGEITVTKKLDKTDRDYQNILNKIMIKNQNNVALENRVDGDFGLTTLNDLGGDFKDTTVDEGAVFHHRKNKNIYETIVIPTPQFITLSYEGIVWTQYTHHMNQIIELLYSSFLPQVQGWKIETDKGYWFVAEIEEGGFESENNFNDLTQGERIIKTKFKFQVPTYILASETPGAPLAVKRYISSPDISFNSGLFSDYGSDLSDNPNIVDDPFLGVDDPTLPISPKSSLREDKRKINENPLFLSGKIADPSVRSLSRGRTPAKYLKVKNKDLYGNEKVSYVRVSNTNKFTGETVFSPNTDINGLIDTKFIGGFPGEDYYVDPIFVFSSLKLLNGTAYSVISDGNNGFYVAGNFNSVESKGVVHNIQKIVKITSDGSIDTNFNPGFSSGVIYSLVLHQNVLYAGCSYSLGGIISLNKDTGSVLWSQSSMLPINSSTVTCLLKEGDYLYVGGYFTQIDGVSIKHLCRFDLNTNDVDESWNPDIFSSLSGVPFISQISSYGEHVYFSGNFNSLSGGTIDIGYFARSSILNGNVDSSWNLNFNDRVECFVIDKEKEVIFAGGSFSSVDSKSVDFIAKISVAGELVDSWKCGIVKKPGLSLTSSPVRGFVLDSQNSLIYVGGSFSGAKVNGVTFYRKSICRFNTEHSALDGWNPEAYDENETPSTLAPRVFGLYSNDESVRISGREFLAIGGEFDGFKRNYFVSGEDFAILDISL